MEYLCNFDLRFHLHGIYFYDLHAQLLLGTPFQNLHLHSVNLKGYIFTFTTTQLQTLLFLKLFQVGLANWQEHRKIEQIPPAGN